MSLDLGGLEERKAQALRDLLDVERQRDAGEIDADTAARLTRQYEAEVVAAVTALAGVPEEEPTARRGGLDVRTITIVGVVVVLCVAVAALVTSNSRPKNSSAASSATSVASATATTRDLSTVTNEEMEQVIAANPTVTPMRLALVERYLRDGNIEKAREHSQLALDNNPAPADRERALKYLGWTTFLMGDAAKGADLLNQALQLDGTDLDAMWFLGNLDLSGLGQPAAAAALFQKIVATPDITEDQRAQVQKKLDEAQNEVRTGVTSTIAPGSGVPATTTPSAAAPATTTP